MADITKTERVLLAHQAVTHPAFVAGTALDVSNFFSAKVIIYHAWIEATANDAGVRYLIQVNPVGSSTEDWATVVEYITNGDTAATEALTATEPAAETSLACASTTGFAVHDIIYLQDTTTLAASEWARLENVVTDTSLELMDGLTTQKDSADVAWGSAEIVDFDIDLAGVSELRIVAIHRETNGSNWHTKVLAVTADAVV